MSRFKISSRNGRVRYQDLIGFDLKRNGNHSEKGTASNNIDSLSVTSFVLKRVNQGI